MRNYLTTPPPQTRVIIFKILRDVGKRDIKACVSPIKTFTLHADSIFTPKGTNNSDFFTSHLY